VSDPPESLHLAVLRWQLIYRRNAGMPAYLEDATEEERDAYREVLLAARDGDARATAALSRRRPRRAAAVR
jgi:hypothetical protein